MQKETADVITGNAGGGSTVEQLLPPSYAPPLSLSSIQQERGGDVTQNVSTFPSTHSYECEEGLWRGRKAGIKDLLE